VRGGKEGRTRKEKKKKRFSTIGRSALSFSRSLEHKGKEKGAERKKEKKKKRVAEGGSSGRKKRGKIRL